MNMTSHRRAPLARPCVLAAALATSAWADGDPICTPRALATIDAWLARHPWKVGQTSPDVRVDAACKASPVDKAVTIVAAAYERGTEYDKNVVVALVDARGGRVAASSRASSKRTPPCA